jgi:hypothetical protein
MGAKLTTVGGMAYTIEEITRKCSRNAGINTATALHDTDI